MLRVEVESRENGSRLRDPAEFNLAWVFWSAQYLMGGEDEVLFFGLEDVRHEFLRVAIDKGKPAALNMNHDAMSWLEGVQDIAEFKADLGRLVGFHRNRAIESFAEATAKDAGADEFLSSAWVGIGSGAGWESFGRGAGKLIDDFDDPIGVGLGASDPEVDLEWTGDGEGLGLGFGAIDQDVGSAGGEALIFGDIVAGPTVGDFGGIGDRFLRIAWKRVATFFGGGFRSDLPFGLEVPNAFLLILGGPVIELPPSVSAGFEHRRFGDGFAPLSFEMGFEEGELDLGAVPIGGGESKIGLAQSASFIAIPATVVPGSHDDAVGGVGILAFDGGVGR